MLRLKCTKFECGWESAPDPAGELTFLPQIPKLDLRSPTSKGREGKEMGRKGKGKMQVKGGRRRREGKGVEGGRERKGREKHGREGESKRIFIHYNFKSQLTNRN